MAEKLKAINQAGVRLAREAAKDDAYVAGAVGPLGVRIEPLGPTSFAEARDSFPRTDRRAAGSAAWTCSILETFGNLDELREAVLRRAMRGGEVPIVAQVTIDDFGHLPGGTDTETFTREMDDWPVRRDRAQLLGRPKATLDTVER